MEEQEEMIVCDTCCHLRNKEDMAECRAEDICKWCAGRLMTYRDL